MEKRRRQLHQVDLVADVDVLLAWPGGNDLGRDQGPLPRCGELLDDLATRGFGRQPERERDAGEPLPGFRRHATRGAEDPESRSFRDHLEKRRSLAGLAGPSADRADLQVKRNRLFDALHLSNGFESGEVAPQVLEVDHDALLFEV